MTAPITTDTARPAALQLISDLGHHVGNPEAIANVLITALRQHGPDTATLALTALGITSAECVTRDPDEASAHQKRHQRPTGRNRP